MDAPIDVTNHTHRDSTADFAPLADGGLEDLYE